MKYVCLVYFEEKKLGAMSKGKLDALVEESLTYDEALRKSGHFIVAQSLQPVQTAMTVRIRNGKAFSTDGPYAETKEQLGAFVLINAGGLHDALHVAAKIPLARLGSVEVRPIRELELEKRDEGGAIDCVDSGLVELRPAPKAAAYQAIDD